MFVLPPVTTIQQEATMPAESRYDEARLRAQDIEDELRRLGRWGDARPADEAFESEAAFFADRMTFEAWLQWVLLPRVREICAQHGEFPPSSQLGPYAVRQFDGDTASGELVTRLAALDQLIESGNDRNAMEAVATVRRFVEATKRKDEAAARAEMIDVQREAQGGGAPDIERYLVRDVLVDGELTVVLTEVFSMNPAGDVESMTMPFVSVRENGKAKVDMERTMARLMGGTGHDPGAELEAAMTGALADVGKQMQDSMDEFERERKAREAAEFAAATAAFDTDHLPGILESIANAFEKPVAVTIDWTGLDESPSLIWDVRSLLGDDLPTAVRSMSEERRVELVARVARVHVATTRDKALRSARVEDDVLTLTIVPGITGGSFSWIELEPWLKWESSGEGREHFRLPVDHAKDLALDLRSRFALPLEGVDLELIRFTTYGDGLRTQWALYQLAELGIDPLGRVLATLLAEDAAFAESARERLKLIVFQPVEDEAQQSVNFVDDVLMLDLYANEGSAGFGGDDALAERVRAALLGP
ncbi:MAG: YqcC family protein [Planctomycetes bacterium]|nr:YqcC family protein [Planctomycetota bacterium]MCC7169199.1 YqcC family protein [Planctomycetota bacterium]